jgi:glycosyltransferase involved in cell wall biosynthesis
MLQSLSVKILHLLHDVRDVGNGIVHAAIDVATYQRVVGHTVAVASGPGAFSGLLISNGVDWYPLPLRRSVRNIALAGFRFRAVVHRFAPDIVHSHGLAGTAVARAWQLRSRYRIVATAHRVYDRDVRLLGLADEIIALSESNAEVLAARGISRSKIHVIKNGTIGTLRRTDNDATAQIELEHPAVVTIAGLYKRKGIDVLISAFARLGETHPNAHLYIIGEGPDRDLFQKMAIGESCSARIHFVGFSSKTQSYLRAADVFVLASRRESFPLVLLEAREAGCAIVATDVDGAKEALDGGDAGILVAADDAPALAIAIDKVLSNPKLAEEYRASAVRSLWRFNAERMALETLAVYV